MRAFGDPFRVLVWLTFQLIVSLADSAQEQNVALNKPVYGKLRGHGKLVDGKLDTAVDALDHMVPMFYIDLEDVYNLSRIEMYAPKDTQSAQKTMGQSLSLYSWTKHTSPCDMEGLYPWTLVKANLTFKSTGEKLTVDQPVEAQYLIILPDFTEVYQTHKGLPMAELMAFGKKIRDGYRFKIPEPGTPLRNIFRETRRELLEGQSTIYAQVSYFEYVPDPKFSDVSLAWQYDRVNTMAAVREKARLILFSGPKALRRLLNWDEYTPLRTNIQKWLNKQNPRAAFVNVSQPFKDGDILTITRFDKFDVEEIARRLKDGKNAAVITYLRGRKDNDTNHVARLMQALDIKYRHATTSIGNLEQDVSSFINSSRDTPWDFELNIALSSWQQFNSKILDYHIPREFLYTVEIQAKVRQVVQKYLDLFTNLAPCQHHAYVNNNKTDIALINYNKVLLLQRGGDVIVAPGALQSPGYVSHIAKKFDVEVEYKEDVYGAYLPTGAYAKPGQAVEYEVLSYSAPYLLSYHIRINPQIDQNYGKGKYTRWPILTYREHLENKGVIVSPMGGPIVVTVPQNRTLKLRLRGVYRYPWFDIRDPNSVKNWPEEQRKYKGVPYGMVAGDMMISMLEERALLRMNPETVRWSVNFFDNMVKLILSYRGSYYENTRMEVFVTDDDIIAGYAHSGYPWMAYREVANNFDQIDRNKAGKNILFPHEIGHNFQVRKMTFRNGAEVTNNAYIAPVRKYLCGFDGYAKGLRPGLSSEEISQMIQTWKGNQFVGVEVSFYSLLSITFGPGLLSNVWTYGTHTSEPLEDEYSKVDFWMKHICQESRRNMVPFHELWHFPMKQTTRAFCAKFPCWFPDDEYTQQVPDIVQRILSKYPNCSRAKPEEIPFKMNITRGFDEIRPQKIFIHTEESG